ncbi:serine hydrolase [Streptomyces sp. NPDC058701]|uniref:serine hydrolase n=1 Tax=Streptomyces sp. NPDC058701 TaxID=3346608 RepID=UPI00366082DA
MKAVTVAGGSSEKPKVEVPEEGPQPPEESDARSTANLPDGDTAAAAAADAVTTGRDVPEDTDAAPSPARAEDPAETGAGTEAEADIEGEAGPEADPDRPADPDTKTGTETRTGADAATDSGPGSTPTDRDGPHTETGPESETRTGADAETGSGAGAGETPAETHPDAETGSRPGSTATAPDGAHTETADTETVDDDRTAPDTTPSAPADGKAEASTEAEPGTDADSAPETAAIPATDADADAEAGPDAAADADADAPAEDEPDRTDAPSPDAKAAGTGGTKPTAADAARRRPSWAQGAEPVAAPKPEAEAESDVESGVDSDVETEAKPEATSTPTSEPDSEPASDADAERTSRFVALRPLDAPPRAAQPTVALPLTAPPAPAPATGAAPAPWPVITRPPAGAPLDLLAELTNTATPPETPRRTALRRVKIWTPILLVLAGVAAGAQLLRPLPETKVVGTESLHTIDGQLTIPWPAKGQGAVRVSGSGDVGTFGEQKPVPTASVAKVMTAYVVLKGHPLRKGEAGPDIAVDAKTVADGTSESESRIAGLVAGTKYSQQDMLKMLMIPSGNNVARLLARWDTGTDSEAAFVEKMNAAAKELGMNDTTYTDPSGLDASTVSTASDQLKLAEAVMQDEAFRAVVALPDARIKGLPEPIYNNNDLLTAPGLSIRGIKTGSSTPAGGTLMWAAYKSVGDETPLVLGTLMDQRVASGPDPDASNSLLLVKANSKKIIEAVRAALTSAPVIRKGQKVGYVDDGLGGRTPLVATKDVNVVGVPGQSLRISLTAAAGSAAVPHSAKAGTELGVLTVGDGAGAKSVPVAVESALAEPSFGTRLTRLR